MRQGWIRRWSIVTLLALCAEQALPLLAHANPVGPNVVAGQATVSGLGTSQVTIAQASQRAIINWQQFNIAPNEITHFIQPDVRSIALNRIFDQNPSQILGTLQANGTVILLNQNGIMFGPNAQVNVGGLVASSLNLSNANFLAGHYLFEGAGIEGMVKNAGTIQARHDGVYLLAPNVENSGMIVSPGGNVVLGAGKTAFLSNRSDGRGFIAEVVAPLGQAVNMKDILADGGQVTLAGQVVNQRGLIQANSVREQRGKIELLARDAVTLSDGSRTVARGGNDGISDGGTVRALADLGTGRAEFQKGAVVDVSGGTHGGNAGSAEISAASVNLRGQFLGRAVTGYKGGRFLIDPVCTGSGGACETSAVDASELAVFAGSGADLVEFRSAPGSGLTVTGTYDLAAGEWQLPAGQRGTIQFTASTGDLVFQDFNLRNTGSGVPWDYVGTADNHIRFNQSFLETGFGGNMAFTATRGSISLVQSTGTGGNLFVQGQLSTVRTSEAGGNITLTAAQDVISPSVFVRDLRLSTDVLRDRFGGIRLDGVGNLTITAGRDFIGGRVNGRFVGPGFVLTDGKADVTAQQIGGPLKGTGSSDDQYAQLTMATGQITLHATKGNVYLGRIQDKGLTDLASNDIQTISVDPNNKVTVRVDEGDLYLNPTATLFSLPSRNTAINVYPASFDALVPKGNVNVENNVAFWGSTTGSVTIRAGKNIQSTTMQAPVLLQDRFKYVFVGTVGQGGTWVLVDVTKASTSPLLAQFLSTVENNPPEPFGLQAPVRPFPDQVPNQSEYVFVGDVGRGGQWVIVNRMEAALNPLLAPYLTRPVPQGAPARPVLAGTPITFPSVPGSIAQVSMRLLQADPALLKGERPANLAALVGPSFRSTDIPDHAPVPVTIEAGTANVAGEGNIRGLILDFGSAPFKKQVTIKAPGNLETVTATLAAPEGVVSLVDVGGTINLASGTGQIAFAGTGTGKVRVGGDLDLGSSDGIRFRRFPTPSTDQNQGGFLDIAVGGDIIMDKSRIATYNGASISIHGLGHNGMVDGAGHPRVENGDAVALVGTSVVGPDGLTRISVNATNSSGQVVPQEVKFEGKTLTLNGTEERLTGPVTAHVALVEKNGQLVMRNGERVEVLRVDGKPVLLNGDVVLVKPIVQVRPDGTVVRDGGTVLLAQAANVSEVTASGGGIKVGSNVASVGTAVDIKGIVTGAGGAIDIKAEGNIDVDKSRIATLGFPATGTPPYRAGDINLVSTKGSIIAGSGGANEVIQQVVKFTPVDPTTGRNLPEVSITIETPGSGIFTYHGSDQRIGEKLVFPRFDDPEINALRNEISKQGFLGHDTSALRAKERQLLAAREPAFTQTFENFIVSKQLGNISLVSKQGNIVVPEAGIRGRRITLFAPRGSLDLRGGTIAGLTSFVASSVQGSVSGSFSGTVSGSSSSGSVSGASSGGGGSLGGITGTTGSVSAASSSATAATTTTAARATADVQEGAADAAGQAVEAKTRQVASKSDEKDKKGSMVAQSIKVKHGVIIQVDVKPKSGG